MTTLPQDRSGQNTETEFRALLDAYRGHLRGAGTDVAAYLSPELPHFRALKPSEQASVTQEVRNTLEIFAEMASEGQSLRDSPKLLWRSLRKLGLLPCSDIFDKIGDEDVVHIVSVEHRQLFQNLKYLELVNLTLEEIYCTEWYKYTRRPEWAQKALYEAGGAVFTGVVQGTFDPGVDEHIAEEANRAEPIRLRVKVKWMSPVKRAEQVVGVIVVVTCTPT